MLEHIDPEPSFSPPPELKSRTARTRVPEPGCLLPRMSMEISRRCNLECIYCYADSSPRRRTGLSDAEVRAVIREGVGCGAALVSFVSGGEPLLRPSLLTDGESCLDFANELGCYCFLYTNCSLIDHRAARWLHRRDVSVVGKLNSLNPEVQDELAGVAGSGLRIRRGVDALLAAGFHEESPSRLGMETIICRQNYDEMPDIWRWMRTHNVVPEVEIPTLHGRALAHKDAICFDDDEAPEKYRVLFDELLRIDQTEFGFDWAPHPPFPAMSCQLFHNNCYVNDHGGVQPCAGVEQEFGQLDVGEAATPTQPLAEIIASESFQRLRDVERHLAEPCRGCELTSECYGCRGAAYHCTGDLFAADPVCWLRPGGRDG